MESVCDWEKARKMEKVSSAHRKSVSLSRHSISRRDGFSNRMKGPFLLREQRSITEFNQAEERESNRGHHQGHFDEPSDPIYREIFSPY